MCSTLTSTMWQALQQTLPWVNQLAVFAVLQCLLTDCYSQLWHHILRRCICMSLSAARCPAFASMHCILAMPCSHACAIITTLSYCQHCIISISWVNLAACRQICAIILIWGSANLLLWSCMTGLLWVGHHKTPELHLKQL